jgi:hypothetical protein
MGPGGGPGHQIMMPPPPGGLMGPGGLGPAGQAGGAPPIAPNNTGIGNGFAPPASFERRQGLPTPTGSVTENESNEIPLDNPEEPATLVELPRAKKVTRYTLIDTDE